MCGGPGGWTLPLEPDRDSAGRLQMMSPEQPLTSVVSRPAGQTSAADTVLFLQLIFFSLMETTGATRAVSPTGTCISNKVERETNGCLEGGRI